MAYIPVEDTAQVNLVQLIDGQEVENILYFLKTAGWNVTTLNLLGASVAAWYEDDLAPYLSSDIALIALRVVDLATETGTSLLIPVEPPVPGSVGVDALPNNVAAVVRFRTEQRGRSFRGRNYVCGIPETNAVNSILTDAVQTAMATAYQNLADVEIAADCVHVVVSRQSEGAPRLLGVTTEVVSYDMDRVVRTQKRRLPRT